MVLPKNLPLLIGIILLSSSSATAQQSAVPTTGPDSCSFNWDRHSENWKTGQGQTFTRRESPNGRASQGYVEDYGNQVGDRACSFVNRWVLWNDNCQEASRGEFLSVNCSGVRGNGYYYPFESLNIDAFNDHWDEETDELVYQTAVGSIHDFAKCQEGIFQSYFNDATARLQLEQDAHRAFEQVINGVQQLFRDRQGQINQGVHGYDEFMQQQLTILMSRIPMGNRDLMRNALISLASTAQIDRSNPLSFQRTVPFADFQRVYAAQMRIMADQTEQTMTRIAGPRGPSGARGGGILRQGSDGTERYCVNTDLKTYLWRSGQINTTVGQYQLTDRLTPGFLCRSQDRFSRACGYAAEVALIPTYFLGYGFARMAARAGVAAVRYATTAAEVSTATRLTMLGLEAADWLTSANAIARDCNMEEMFTNISRHSCEPNAELTQVYEEASMGQCLTSVVLSGVTPFIGAAARGRSALRLREIAQAAPVAATENIVATASRRSFYLSAARSDQLEAQLTSAGIRLDGNLSESAQRVLTPDQRLFLIERAANTAFTPSEALTVLDILGDIARRGGARTERDLNRLREVLLSSRVAPEEVDDVLRVLRERNLLTAAPARELASATTNAAPYIDDAARVRISRELPPRPLTREQALALSPEQRIFLAEEMMGTRLTAAEAERLLETHRLGSADNLTLGQVRARADAVRAILVARGTGPDDIRRITRDLIEGYVLGQRAERGLIARLLSRVGIEPRPTVATPIDPAAARRAFNDSRSEVLDPDLVSDQARLAQSIDGTDLFNPFFSGNIDQMVRAQRFRLSSIGGADGSYWWRSSEFIPGARSRSPLASVYAESAGGIENVRRQVFWPVRMDQSRGTTDFLTVFDRQRVVVNQTRNSAGEWVDSSIEVIARDANGNFVPFFYVKRGNEWVLSRTFRGEPVERACIACHHHPSRPSVFTVTPYRGLATNRPMHSAGDAVRAADPSSISSVNSELSRIYGRGEGLSASSADIYVAPRDFSGSTPAEIAAMSPVDRFRAADRLLPARGFIPTEGVEANVAARRVLTSVRTVPVEDGPTYLRYGMTRQQLDEYRAANGGASPAEILSESDVSTLVERGFLAREN